MLNGQEKNFFLFLVTFCITLKERIVARHKKTMRNNK